MMANSKRAKTAYIDAKRVAKHAVWLAKSEVEKEEFAPGGDGVFCKAKQMDRRNQDIVGENCIHNGAGELALTDKRKMMAWVEHYVRLLNDEFVLCPSNELPDVPPTAGPPPSVTTSQIRKALSKMKCSKAAGPSGIVAEVLKAAGEEGVELTNQQSLFSAMVWSHQTGRRASFWSPTRAKMKPLTVAIIVVSNSQIESWSCWNGYSTSTYARWWTSMRCSSALCLVEGPLVPSSLFASHRRCTSLLCLHRPWESLRSCTKEGPMVGLKEPWGGITRWLVEDPNFNCLRCKGESRPIDGGTVTEVDVDGTMLDVEATFCYLGDILCSSGSCDSAVAARCFVAWGKFRPILTFRHISPKIHGELYVACVQAAMLHGSELWGPKEPMLQ